MTISRLFATVGLAAALVVSARADAMSFAAAHPDRYFRGHGLYLHKRGEAADAVASFKRSARFGDKPSQLVLALMHFEGDGIEKDRALAYAWADLAAERGYPDFVAFREAVWNALTEEERARAVEVGKPLYEEFGDDAAKPRLEHRLRIARATMTGSRAGYDMGAGLADYSKRALIGTAAYFEGPNDRPVGAQFSEDGLRLIGFQHSDFWDPAEWDPKQYWAAQDARFVRRGTVTVGELLKGDTPR